MADNFEIINNQLEVDIISGNIIDVDIVGYASGGVTSYEQLNDVPTEFNPSAHTQDISTINNLQSELDLKANISDLDLKVDKILNKQLSTEDYTTSEKNKLAGIANGAEVNVQSDWNSVSGDSLILNKPDITSISRQSISENVVGLDYNNTTGIISLSNNYIIPTITEFNNKIDIDPNKGLSENDFTDALKSKLDGIEANAEKNDVFTVNGHVGSVSLTSSDIPELNNLYYTNQRVDTRINLQKGEINGIASLDSGGKVPIIQLPNLCNGSILYAGTWDASTGNFPTTTPKDKEFWIITTSGIINYISYHVGDWIIYDAELGWKKAPAGSIIYSVNGQIGDVNLVSGDVSESTNLYYTEGRVSDNTDVQKGVTANSWGNHADIGYALDSTVVHNTGNETISGIKTFQDEISASNLSGENTGDQDLSGLATKVELQQAKMFAIAMAVAL